MSEDFLVFAFDPGEVNNGFAMFRCNETEKTAELKIMTAYTPKELNNMLKTIHSMAESSVVQCVFVVENFRVDLKARSRTARSNTFQWSEMQTIRRIGAIEFVAESTGSEIVFQEPQILHMARKWCDLSLPKGHIPDNKSAYIHGAHYICHTRRIVSVPEKILKFGQESAF